jgi:hypothetical protein
VERARAMPSSSSALADALSTADAQLQQQLDLIPTSPELEAIIARAENALEAGEVAVSITELAQLSADHSTHFSQYLEKALSYAKISSTIDALLVDMSSIPAPATDSTVTP